jgi:hypothetical protein
MMSIQSTPITNNDTSEESINSMTTTIDKPIKSRNNSKASKSNRFVSDSSMNDSFYDSGKFFFNSTFIKNKNSINFKLKLCSHYINTVVKQLISLCILHT